MSKKVCVVGIGGGTCSGKSTLTDKLEVMLSKKNKVSVLRMDDYYNWSDMKTIAPITRIEYPEHNHPDAVDMDNLYKKFIETITDNNNDIVLLEGIFSFYFDQLRDKLDLKIFVDLKSDERMYRRIKRLLDYGEPLDDIAQRYLDTVRYRHDEFVEQTRWYADLVVNGNSDLTFVANLIVSCIKDVSQ